ncbi:MAG TPA: glycerol kinase GlpK [Planctomycetota bacterium]|nr:glycerol kinase GlpK [Planctomycetota bacterium]
MTYILALDQGTTSSRALVFDDARRICGVAQQEFTQHFPQPGWVEHDAREIWQTQLATAREAIAKAGIAARQLAAIGIANQRETVVLWDRATGEPVHRAIVWQDRRTTPACEKLRAGGLAPMLTAKTGLVPDPYFSATKLAWLLDAIPGLRARAEAGQIAAGTIDSWLIWNLTGGKVHATDVTNASRTLLMNLRTGAWDAELLKLFRIPVALLPAIVPSSGVVTACSPELFGVPIPIAGIAGDQQAALFGQGCLTPGLAKNTYGTGCFLLMQAGATVPVSHHGLLSTVAWKLGDQPLQYALEGAVFVAGAAVQWLRDQLGLIRTAAEIEALAQSVPDAGGVHFVPAFAGLGAPFWDPVARGLITGLTRGTNKGHIARATLEAIAFQTRDVVLAVSADAPHPLSELRVDGGGSVNDLLMQIQADALGVPVLRPAVTETTALGAALLAGLAVGVYAGPEALARGWTAAARFEPTGTKALREQRHADWRRAVQRARSVS